MLLSMLLPHDIVKMTGSQTIEYGDYTVCLDTVLSQSASIGSQCDVIITIFAVPLFLSHDHSNDDDDD